MLLATAAIAVEAAAFRFPSADALSLRNAETMMHTAIKQGAVVACCVALSLQQPQSAAAAADSIFVGRYSDPNNHPGGYREISLLPGGVGAYRLANVHGGMGRGEPESYDLPAIIVERPEQQQIIIDFSVPPKNGPRDFAGVWDAKSKGIRFIRDGNIWPRE